MQIPGVMKMTRKESSELARKIGLNITNLLIKADKNQDDLAKALGVSKATISLWCSGKRTPRMEHVDKIARFFSTTRSAILEDEQKSPQITDQMRTELNRLVDERIQAAGNQNPDVRTDGHPQEYYDDATVQRVAEAMRTNPGSRVIFDAVSTMEPEDLELIARLVEKMSD